MGKIFKPRPKPCQAYHCKTILKSVLSPTYKVSIFSRLVPINFMTLAVKIKNQPRSRNIQELTAGWFGRHYKFSKIYIYILWQKLFVKIFQYVIVLYRKAVSELGQAGNNIQGDLRSYTGVL